MERFVKGEVVIGKPLRLVRTIPQDACQILFITQSFNMELRRKPFETRQLTI